MALDFFHGGMKMKRPVVSVIIPAHNEERYVARCIASVKKAAERYGREVEIIVVCNFVPVARTSYCFGVPYAGEYTEVLNCTSPDGSPVTNGTVHSKPVPMHGLEHSICIDIPAYGCMYFKVKKDKPKKTRKPRTGTSGEKKSEAKKTASKAKTPAGKSAPKKSAKNTKTDK